MRRVATLAMVLAIATSASGQDDIATSDPSVDQGGFNPKVDEYEVVEGDTLWDISARVVGDPFLWPRVWSYNPEITNPHWIYPGDRVRFFPSDLELPSQSDLVAGGMELPEEPKEDVAEIQEPEETRPDAGPVIEVIDTRRAAGHRYVDRRFLQRFISDKELEEAGTLTNAAPDHILLSTGDLVFFDFPSSKRPPKGKRIMTFRTLGEVSHPDSGDREGYVTQITSVMKVVSNKEDAVTRARVEQTIHDVERGQHALMMDHEPYITVATVPTGKLVKGIIMAVRDTDALVVGDQDLVFIDKGKKDGLERGNQLRVFATGDRLTETKQGESYEIGRLQVIDAQDRTSTCLVVEASFELEAGAPVETVVGPPDDAPG